MPGMVSDGLNVKYITELKIFELSLQLILPNVVLLPKYDDCQLPSWIASHNHGKKNLAGYLCTKHIKTH